MQQFQIAGVMSCVVGTLIFIHILIILAENQLRHGKTQPTLPHRGWWPLQKMRILLSFSDTFGTTVGLGIRFVCKVANTKCKTERVVSRRTSISYLFFQITQITKKHIRRLTVAHLKVPRGNKDKRYPAKRRTFFAHAWECLMRLLDWMCTSHRGFQCQQKISKPNRKEEERYVNISQHTALLAFQVPEMVLQPVTFQAWRTK